MRELKEQSQEVFIPQNSELQDAFFNSIEMVDDIILKKYLSHLNEYPIIPMKQGGINIDIDADIRLFKVDEMVYEKDGFSSDKFATLFSTFSNKAQSFFLLIDSDGEQLDLYFGVNTNGGNISSNTIKKGFESTLKSQFPGVKTTNIKAPGIRNMHFKIKDYRCVSSYSGVAYDRIDDSKEFIQGLEKFLMSMNGKKFTSIILATPLLNSELEYTKKQLESIYTNLSAYKTSQIGYTLTSSKNKGFTKTSGENWGNSQSITNGTSYSEGTTDTKGTSYSKGITDTKGSSQSSVLGEALSLVGKSMFAGIAAGATVATGGLAAPALIAAGATASVAAGSVLSKRTTNKSQSVSETSTENFSQSKSYTSTSNESKTDSENYGQTYSESENIGISIGDSQSLTLNRDNKEIINILETIDEQLERQKAFDNTGAFGCAAYFLSDSYHEAEFAASSYKALVSGEKTATETTAVNVWKENDSRIEEIKKYLQHFIHPVFEYNKFYNVSNSIHLTPMSVVSGRELAIHMGLPRKSILNFPVVEHATYGTSVLKYDKNEENINKFSLGNVYHLGEVKPQQVNLDIQSLSMHTFITGSTGSGKSNTVTTMLEKLNRKDIKFLVVEPAKGEYKNALSQLRDANISVYGTNPKSSELLRINPFYFPEDIHVLEHIDRLIEIFNVCWPMYAAMPAILKEAVLNSYQKVGWDLITSQFTGSVLLYPNFVDLEEELEHVINNSKYSDESKGNYIGALVTRVHSLSTGLNQFIFSGEGLSDEALFDENVIVDLSRVGSSETKSLIMGLLVMKLNEYRMSQAQQLGVMNQPLKHVTVLEEAHNLLKRTSQEQTSEGSNLVGKSVEMLSNSIAEMRTYGEGFIIVDQSPTSVDISAIKNTNTKIIMRVPEFSDRELVGKSVALDEDQIIEIAKLPKGVGVVYQNDWVEPVLCQISKAKSEPSMYQFTETAVMGEKKAKRIVVAFLMSNQYPVLIQKGEVKEALNSLRINSHLKRDILNLLETYDDKTKEYIFKNIELVHMLKQVIGLSDDYPKDYTTVEAMNKRQSYFKSQINQKVDELNPKCVETIAMLFSQTLV